jgi:hypothetical protein
MNFGAGHVMDMVNRIKQNHAIRPSNRARFKENQRQAIFENNTQSNVLRFRVFCKLEVAKIKSEIRRRKRLQSTIEKGLFALVFTCGALFTAWILWVMFA